MSPWIADLLAWLAVLGAAAFVLRRFWPRRVKGAGEPAPGCGSCGSCGGCAAGSTGSPESSRVHVVTPPSRAGRDADVPTHPAGPGHHTRRDTMRGSGEAGAAEHSAHADAPAPKL